SVAFGGGTGTPTFVWATIPVQNTAVANNLIAGNYTVIVTDQNGCQDSITASITDLGGPTATIPAFTNASCAGINDGNAQSSVSGGAYPYTFLWSGGTLGGGLTPNDSIATGLAGQVGGQTYNLTVTDFNGCIATASVSISQNPSIVTVINASTDVSCFGLADGTATTIASGGTGAGTYTYSWDGGLTPNLVGATGLAAGTYNVIVTDANLCSTTDQIIINQPDILTINNFIIDSVNCSGNNDGQININVIGGATGGYTYAWTPIIAGNGPTAAGLPAGVYDVIVTDPNLCTTTGNYTIFTPDPLAIGAITIQSTCGNANGSAQVTLVTGGTNPYAYSWNTPGGTQTTALASNLSAGNYVATVNDANGCTTSEAVVITDKPLPIIDSILVYNVSCFGLIDGSAKVFVSGNDPISYSWNDPAGQTTDSIFGLASSLPLYSVTVTDSNNCTTTGVAQITQPNVLTATINAPNIICYNEDFQLFANANGGTLPYADFAWTGEIVQNSASQGPIFDTLTTIATYNLVVTDGNGCQSTMVTHSVDVTAQPNFSVNPESMCQGDSIVLFPINITGNINYPFNFIWSEVDSTSMPVTYTYIQTSDSLIAKPALTTNYAVYLDNFCAQSEIKPVTVTVNDTAINVFPLIPPVCQGLASEFAVSNDIGVTFSWDFNGDSITDQTTTDSNTFYVYPSYGYYDVSVNVLTAEGCLSTAYYPVQIQVFQNPVADFATDPSPAVVSLLNPTVEFNETSDYNTDLKSISWNFGDGSFNLSETNPIHNYIDTGFYSVTLIIENTNGDGCRDSITKTIRVKPELLFVIPNSFTPDGDGLNDVFMPGTMIGVDEKDYGFYIFDRWGELLYEGHNITDGWSGQFKGNLVKTGIYVWRIDVTDLEGVVHKYNGNVNVLK
ncbi:MAG: gliding motility-associated C-terminal domain-containing protein, partial [Vicingaceae bacterium]